MGGHVRASARCLLDDHTNLLWAVLRDPYGVRQGDHAAGGHDLDGVGSGAKPFSHRHAQRFHAVDDLGAVAARAAEVQVCVPRVAVTAGLAQRGSRVEVAGGLDHTFGDRSRHADVPSGYIAHRGEPSAECSTQAPRPHQCHEAGAARLHLHHVQADAIGVEVVVDEAGRHDAAPSVEDVTERPEPSAHLGDDTILDADVGVEHVGVMTVEHPCVRDRDGPWHSASLDPRLVRARDAQVSISFSAIAHMQTLGPRHPRGALRTVLLRAARRTAGACADRRGLSL